MSRDRFPKGKLREPTYVAHVGDSKPPFLLSVCRVYGNTAQADNSAGLWFTVDLIRFDVACFTVNIEIVDYHS